MLHISAGLEYIHEQCEVHRAIAPTNSITCCMKHLAKISVLYSTAEQLWKLADFELTSGGTGSTGTEGSFVATHSRGTCGYRAPELFGELGGHTNKVDIWALGCIAYELVTRTKLYNSDWELYAHLHEGSEFKMPCLSHHGRHGEFWEKNIVDMLETDPNKRPSAHILHQKFMSKWNQPELKYIPHSMRPRLCSANEGIGDYLKSCFPRLMSNIEENRKKVTLWEATQSCGSDPDIMCHYKIGMGASAFVFEVASRIVRR